MNFNPEKLLRIADNIERIGKTHEAGADLAKINREIAEEARLRKRANGAVDSAWHIREAHRLLATRQRVAAGRAKFVPPTFSELRDHAADKFPRWPASDMTAWHNHFESVGWKVGSGKQMIDWKAAAANGYRNWLEKNPAPGAPVAPRAPVDPPGWRDFLAEQGKPYTSFPMTPGWLREEFTSRGRK